MELGEEDILKYEDTLENLTVLTKESKETEIVPPVTDKLKKIQQYIYRNRSGADLTICILIAALKSYRTDKCLRPFPPMFIKNNEKNFQQLKNVCDIIPTIKEILSKNANISEEVVDLLYWLLVEKNFPLLKPCNLTEIPLKTKNKNLEPQYVFEVCYPKSADEAFKNRIGKKQVLHAYHGSAMDNFYSILKVGLQQHFSVGREVLFGNGVYLSSEISVCTQYAPFGKTWRNSSLGYKHSIITICEIINDIGKVKCKDAQNKNRSHNDQSYGEIPEKYFVVTDSDMLRVKYLMVYSCKNKKSVKSFITKHLFYIILIVYFFMLVVIGFFRDPNWSRVFRWLK
ncbi:unnamed protein product [Brassicogethes aeneus]|uniref:PARP n=1 Tax=Brassicogethes aeneus TaxID=1431903 RepID=A0A9P0FPD9_BRAAE|nr:unnamed protein product [Brassicogethes aeneus]